ncbi:MAG: ribonuclease III, partial [Patescibacteria group bacterium]
KPKNITIYKTAFTHKSANKIDEQGNRINYERLEFLGDALLDASITSFLFHHLPNSKEGELTQMRSKIVSRKHLNEIGKDLELVSFAKKPTSRRKFSYNAHGDFFEALIAAIYLDRGYVVMDKFIKKKLIDRYVDLDQLLGKVSSYKSLFIEWCQKKQNTYEYKTYEDSGNSNIKHFSVKLLVENKIAGKARATSKKKAEEIASRRAFYKFQEQIR